jgi:hypothetical protein
MGSELSEERDVGEVELAAALVDDLAKVDPVLLGACVEVCELAPELPC